VIRRTALDVLAGLAAGTLVKQLASAAEPARKLVRLGFVSPGPSSMAGTMISAFWDRLRQLDYVQGNNLIVERHWADGHPDRLPALMEQVIGLEVDVLFTYSTPAAIAAKNATGAIPIVAAAMGDPVGTGLAVSLAHLGGASPVCR